MIDSLILPLYLQSTLINNVELLTEHAFPEYVHITNAHVAHSYVRKRPYFDNGCLQLSDLPWCDCGE